MAGLPKAIGGPLISALVCYQGDTEGDLAVARGPGGPPHMTCLPLRAGVCSTRNVRGLWLTPDSLFSPDCYHGRMLQLVLLIAFAGAVAAQEMTTYYVAFLRLAGNPPKLDAEAAKKLQADHMAHIRKMAEDGKLLLAGPFSDGTALRGMFVFKTATLEEAKAAAEQDPTVKAGRLVLEWHPWYSAKGIKVETK